MMDVYIKGISYYLPEGVLTNDEIVEKFPEWTTEKINSKIGIKERHVTRDDETALDLGICASRKLFKEYNINSADMVLIPSKNALIKFSISNIPLPLLSFCN